MANQRYQPRISSDRFQRPYQLKFAAQVFNKKSGEVLDNVYKTYFELGGKTYQVEVSKANKTKETRYGERSGVWVKITKTDGARPRPTSM